MGQQLKKGDPVLMIVFKPAIHFEFGQVFRDGGIQIDQTVLHGP
jgi:hypothetical protein